MLTIALSKGRILEQTLPLLKKAGLSISDKEFNYPEGGVSVPIDCNKVNPIEIEEEF